VEGNKELDGPSQIKKDNITDRTSQEDTYTTQNKPAQSRSQCLEETITVKVSLKFMTAKKETRQRRGGTEEGNRKLPRTKDLSSVPQRTAHPISTRPRTIFCRRHQP
jgi:hypothetical protein